MPATVMNSGWASLTPAELRVTRLVADGLTNRAVAGVLNVSPHTVDTHLRHIFGKLQISGRVALARHVLTHDDGAEPGI
ncbi:helix-turn-helix transcriptional regulator [Streptomyces sp. NPDC020141]|uniref:helix-turn-helix transcriptional regulator n=1 Tax=Streptomyces sp. NPDC020141 TaxID=3365065 RepID=UPI00379061D0